MNSALIRVLDQIKIASQEMIKNKLISIDDQISGVLEKYATGELSIDEACEEYINLKIQQSNLGSF